MRKYGAYATGITQNVEDMLQSHTARTMLANSELIVMLNQASTDRLELAKLLNISDLQMSYITNVNVGEGLIKIGSSLIPFVNKFPRNTELYRLMTTKPRRRCNIMKKILYIIFVVLLISLILVSSHNIFKQLQEEREQEKVFGEIIEIVEENNNEYKEEQKRNLKQLYEMNNDFIGWLEIEDTTISYPIMQTKNNPNYYLKRDFYKKYSSYGTPYIAEQCNISKSDNIIIYGHHMKNKSMFGALENYKNKEFYNKHQIITFETQEKKKEYEIFSVFKTVAYSNKGFKYYDYTDFENIEDYNDFIKKCKELSMYETNKNPKENNKLLTLSTCEYSNTNGRLVVIAYEINS